VASDGREGALSKRSASGAEILHTADEQGDVVGGERGNLLFDVLVGVRAGERKMEGEEVRLQDRAAVSEGGMKMGRTWR
jgi:hypothetical protein